MITEAVVFLIETAAWLITIALLLRFLLQWVRAPRANPVSTFVNPFTDWAVRPARRVVPGLWGLDLASLVVAWLVQFVAIFLVLQVRGYDLGSQAGYALGAMLLLAGVMLVRYIIYIVIFVLIVQMVLSWVNPYSELSPALNAVTRPLLRPFQRRIRPIGNVDLSPLFLIILCQLVLMVPVAWAQMALTRML